MGVINSSVIKYIVNLCLGAGWGGGGGGVGIDVVKFG